MALKRLLFSRPNIHHTIVWKGICCYVRTVAIYRFGSESAVVVVVIDVIIPDSINGCK